ncbi:hypothetical protein CIK02_19375 [Pseudomonas putida]|nr:hypothetical protein CIK02_19375 [Pseudomonas putida]
MRATALAHVSISRRTNKAVARDWCRRDWPETNVGAGLPAKRRAGGARSLPHHNTQTLHPCPTTTLKPYTPAPPQHSNLTPPPHHNPKPYTPPHY